MTKKMIRKSIIFAVAVFTLGIILSLVVGIRPCGGIDKLFNYSGCVIEIKDDVARKATFTTVGDILAVSSFDVELRLWRVSDGELIDEVNTSTNSLGTALAPDGNIAAVTSRTGVELWSKDSKRLLRILRGDGGYSVDVVFSPDGEMVAALVIDYINSRVNDKVHLWRVEDGQLLHTFYGHTDHISEIAFTPDGTILASASDDGTVHLWRTNDGELLQILKGHENWVKSIAFSPDGSILASGGGDSTIRLWRVDDGTLLNVLDGRQGIVYSLDFSPDGKTLASGGNYHTVRLWDVSSGALLHTLRQGIFWGWPWSLDFSPDGTKLAVVQSSGPVRLFDIEQLNLRN